MHNHEDFEENIEKILQYVQEIIANLPFRRATTKDEQFLILESLILRACALWEKFLETELLLAVSYDSVKLIKEMNLRSTDKLNLELVRAILLSDSYRDFHDLERSNSFFRKYIVDKWNPFNKISGRQTKKIQFTYSIRNYLSHYSKFAKKKLLESYKKEYNLSLFPEPGQFLYAKKCARFKDLVENFKFCSINMKTVFK